MPEKLIALKKVIDEAMRNYAVCDELCYKLPEQDFKLRWDLYSWPKKITDECVELEEKCIRLENKQQIEMEEAQAEFAETSVARRPLTFRRPYAIDDFQFRGDGVFRTRLSPRRRRRGRMRVYP